MEHVQLHAKGVGKFVLLLTCNSQIILKSCDDSFAYHNEILKLFDIENNEAATCIGGGHILITKYSIKCYGRSLEYGAANDLIVTHLLTKYVPDKEIIVDLPKF